MLAGSSDRNPNQVAAHQRRAFGPERGHLPTSKGFRADNEGSHGTRNGAPQSPADLQRGCGNAPTFTAWMARRLVRLTHCCPNVQR
jgi:hypothetical protein